MNRACVLLLACGCSMATMQNPPPPGVSLDPAGPPPECTSSKGAPVVDIGLAVTAGLVGFSLLFAAALESSFGSDNDADELAIAGTLIGVGGGVGFTVSGVSGFRKARECRAAEEAYNWSRAPAYAPAIYQPPPIVPFAQPGSERGLCRFPPAPPCDGGLTCASNYCVRLPPLQ